jgi:site-specific recombinase XerC
VRLPGSREWAAARQELSTAGPGRAWELVFSCVGDQSDGSRERVRRGGYPTRAAARHARDAALGSAWVDSGKVFTRENGEPLHPAMVSDRFHDLVVAADLFRCDCTNLRHGAASLMLAAGVDLKVVQETLGHSSITPHQRHLHVGVPGGRRSCS